MLEDLLSQNEGKTLEFKENASNTIKIIKTAIAFANTAGGIIVVGVRDKTKEVIGVQNVLQEEERITNVIVDLIAPLLVPDIDIISYEDKELLLINIPHLPGPFHLKKSRMERGTYVRLGSTNRLADSESLANLQRLAKRISFDELPCVSAEVSELDKKMIQEKLKHSFKNITAKHYESLGIVRPHNRKKFVTYGGLLLFGKDKNKWLPDAMIKCVSFAGTEKKNIIDKRAITSNLIDSVDDAMLFIQRNTKVAAQIGAIKRVDIPEYPLEAVREAVINAIVHADYSIKGASIQISIYSDRIEIINPGSLTYGQTMDSALSGVSKMRNPIIGRIFREIGLIETLGMGMLNITGAYVDAPNKTPIIEEIDHFFKVVLFSKGIVEIFDKPWVKQLQDILKINEEISTSEMAEIWGVSVRTARDRLNTLLEKGYIKRNATSKNDPNATYSNA